MTYDFHAFMASDACGDDGHPSQQRSTFGGPRFADTRGRKTATLSPWRVFRSSLPRCVTDGGQVSRLFLSNRFTTFNAVQANEVQAVPSSMSLDSSNRKAPCTGWSWICATSRRSQ
jgi:hypothetical protein